LPWEVTYSFTGSRDCDIDILGAIILPTTDGEENNLGIMSLLGTRTFFSNSSSLSQLYPMNTNQNPAFSQISIRGVELKTLSLRSRQAPLEPIENWFPFLKITQGRNWHLC
jgi:hypothetical protein